MLDLFYHLCIMLNTFRLSLHQFYCQRSQNCNQLEIPVKVLKRFLSYLFGHILSILSFPLSPIQLYVNSDIQPASRHIWREDMMFMNRTERSRAGRIALLSAALVYITLNTHQPMNLCRLKADLNDHMNSS